MKKISVTLLLLLCAASVFSAQLYMKVTICPTRCPTVVAVKKSHSPMISDVLAIPSFR